MCLPQGSGDKLLDFYWLREAWSGAWCKSVYAGASWPADVPSAIRAELQALLDSPCEELRGLAPGRPIEIHLAYEVFRQGKPDSFDILVEPGGRILVRDRISQSWPETLNLYQTRLMTAAALHAERKSTMRLRAATPSGKYLELPARAFVRWKAPPLPGHGPHFTIFAHVSVAIQKAFRHYLLEAYFDTVERYEHRAAAWSVLAFCCSRPYYPRLRGDFTHDVMSFEVARKSLRFTRIPLERKLAEVEETLVLAGRNDLAAFHGPHRIKQILAEVVKDDKYLVTLLRTESKLVEVFVRFAYEMRSLRERQRGQRTLRARNRTGHDAIRIANDTGRRLNSLLRRMFLLRDFFELGSILLLEATYALNGRKTSIAERDRFADADSLLEFGDTEPSGQSLDEAFGQCEAEVELAIAEEVGLPEDDPEREPEDLFEDAGEIAPEDDDSAESDGDAPEPEAITAGSTDEPGTVRS